MAYQVVLPKSAQKELKRIDGRYRTRVIDALAALGNDPYLGKRLQGDYADIWSLRVWPYRILYEIKRKRLIVQVIRITHRQSAY